MEQQIGFVESFDAIDLRLHKVCALIDLIEHCDLPEYLNKNTLGFTGEILREMVTGTQAQLKAIYDAERKRRNGRFHESRKETGNPANT